MKRIISLLVILVLVLGMSTQVFASASEESKERSAPLLSYGTHTIEMEMDESGVYWASFPIEITTLNRASATYYGTAYVGVDPDGTVYAWSYVECIGDVFKAVSTSYSASGMGWSGSGSNTTVSTWVSLSSLTTNPCDLAQFSTNQMGPYYISMEMSGYVSGVADSGIISGSATLAW